MSKILNICKKVLQNIDINGIINQEVKKISIIICRDLKKKSSNSEWL